MIGINTFFQYISLRRRIIITISILTVLTISIGLYALMAIVESNNRLQDSIRTGQAMSQMVDTARLAQVHFKKQVQEWKDMLLRGNDHDLFEKHLRAFENEDRLVNDYLRTLAKITESMNIVTLQIDESIRVHERLGHKYREALKYYRQADLRSAVIVDKMVRGIDREPTDRMDALLYSIKGQAEKRLKETEILATTTLQAYKSFSFFLIFLVLVGVGFGISMAYSILGDLNKEDNGNKIENKDQEM
ncbi:MAG: hypothetical protein ABSB79_05970 [Syntrophales bacterium]|jgi:methyl-accepting chemotaxis protein